MSITGSYDRIQGMIRVRIAPSPTGIPHIGTTRTALYNYLFAQKNKGKFILRIEDTDQKRLIPGSLPKILQIFKLLGLKWDEGPFIQSERLNIYKKYAKELVDSKKAYYCFCSQERLDKLRKEQRKAGQLPKYDRYCLKLSPEEIKKKLSNKEKFVIRMKIPSERIIFWNDLIQGKMEFESNILDDQVLLKSDGFPTYHLAVVVDDYLMKISHVLRGVEWLSSTPKHILLYQAFNWPLPHFAHMPLILGPDKAKLSKRHGAKSALDYQSEGYLPEAIINFMAFLGWSYKDNSDLLSLKQLVEVFDLSKVRKSNPIFDLQKLDWFNSQWIQKLSDKELLLRVKSYLKIKIKDETLLKIIPLLKTRIQKLNQVNDLIEFFLKLPDYDKKIFKGERAKEELEEVYQELEKLKNWQANEIYKLMKEICNKGGYNKKDFYVNLYIALEGKQSGLPVFDSMEILGKKEVLERIKISSSF